MSVGTYSRTVARGALGALGALLAALALTVAAPSAALAASGTNPLSGFPNPPVSTATSQAAPVVTNGTGTSGDSNLSGSNTIAIALGAIVVLVGISLFIWRDARRRAPVKTTGGGVDGRSRAGSKPARKPRKLSPAERRRRRRGRARK